MKNNLLSEKLIYTGDSLTPTHLHLCSYNATGWQEQAGDSFATIQKELHSNNLLSEKLIYTGDSLTPTHLHLCSYNATGWQEQAGDSFATIQKELHSDRINWLQVHGLKNTKAIQEICSYFNIDFLILQDILNANHPTKIEEHENYLVLILKLFHPHHEENEMEELTQQQVCMILGDRFVLTFLEEETDFFNDVTMAIHSDILHIRNKMEELTQQQVCMILGDRFVLTFLEEETDFFNDVTMAIHSDILHIRNKESDYLLSVLLNSIMGNYIATVSSIDDALGDLEEELLGISKDDDIGTRCSACCSTASWATT